MDQYVSFEVGAAETDGPADKATEGADESSTDGTAEASIDGVDDASSDGTADGAADSEGLGEVGALGEEGSRAWTSMALIFGLSLPWI